ncbi:spore germination protein KA [Paenibacillus sp. JGP012]|uniref:spore germination protein n=1 Tax=Paenibacillus sp. JGP012 TaxID=2735914 RepID=UPI00160DB22F|nr:spore germination protein [Paenibacillus sp. JGP012]MBB6019875.1 spore germination protein KA [Paenibacillus sp. JGP012]
MADKSSSGNNKSKASGSVSNQGQYVPLGLPSPPILKQPISAVHSNQIQALKEIFSDCSDVVFRNVMISPDVQGLLVYVEGIVNSADIQEHMLRPLIRGLVQQRSDEPDVPIDDTRIELTQVKRVKTWDAATEGVLASSALLVMDGKSEAWLFNVKGGVRRGVEEPQTESVIRGPREGFTETLRMNTALLRFKLKTPALKMVSLTLGTDTKTDVVLIYLEGIADPKMIQDAKKRLEKIEIDGILESGYIEELIEDHPYSPFPQMHYSERPDTVAGNLLEGRFSIMVDGTPFALIAPVTMWQMLQASEDYYERFFISNLIRWIRFLFVAIALFLPALYIAITTYHQDMLPTTLILSIAGAREAIPFPALIEALIMELSFEALREAGVRLPKTVGQAVSILGALVIGQAAVQAGIVSAPMVIIVSMTGIASFTIPRFNFAITVRLLRFPIMLLAGMLGLYGIVIGLVLISVHLTQMTSFGVPYLSGVSPYSKKDTKDILVRVPWWKMINRPSTVNRDRKRMTRDINGSPEAEEGW